MDKVGYKTTHNIIDSSTQLYLYQKNTQLYLIMKKMNPNHEKNGI